jgi:hypothetical protein
MSFTLRTIDPQRNFASQLSMQALEKVIPCTVIEAVLTEHQAWHERARKLTMVTVVLVLIAMNLYRHVSMGHVLRKVAQGLRFLWPDPDYDVAKAQAVSYRRYQLGAAPMVDLFKEIARPMAREETQGAFLFGLRLMALDGSKQDVPDTAENAAVFGRPETGRGRCAFPQVRCVYLAESGTHAICDAGFWPIGENERTGGFRLLRSVSKGMLLMWDRGFHSFDMVEAAIARGTDVLSRLPAHVKPKVIKRLADGSSLVRLLPSHYRRRRQGVHLVVRLIEYTITDEALPGYGERHRLITTLLDPDEAPALDLACAYHERWELELTIDEVKTHQLASQRLRSQKPVGVIQELYGLLLAHYAVRSLMHEAALVAEVDPDRLSFTHCLRVIRDAMAEFEMVAAIERDRLYRRLLRDLASALLPERRLRLNPRVVKRQMSNYKLKRPEHAHWPQPTVSFCQLVALI